MPESDSIVKTETPAALAAKERAIANSQIDHEAIYAHVAANKIELFGPKVFSTCPQCDRQYRIFNNPCWKGDQSVCQACADENFAFTRYKMQKIEHAIAEQELAQLNYSGPFAALSGAPA